MQYSECTQLYWIQSIVVLWTGQPFCSWNIEDMIEGWILLGHTYWLRSVKGTMLEEVNLELRSLFGQNWRLGVFVGGQRWIILSQFEIKFYILKLKLQCIWIARYFNSLLVCGRQKLLCVEITAKYSCRIKCYITGI